MGNAEAEKFYTQGHREWEVVSGDANQKTEDPPGRIRASIAHSRQAESEYGRTTQEEIRRVTPASRLSFHDACRAGFVGWNQVRGEFEVLRHDH